MKLLFALALALLAAPSARAEALDPESLYRLPVGLQDADGKRFDPAQLRGHPVLITLFFASCPQACPLMISKMQRVEKQLTPAERADTRMVMVSLDPQRDTPEVLRAVGEVHHLDRARWDLLRTDPDGVRQLAAALGIKYHPLNNGSIWHASVLVVLDRQGRIQARAEGLGGDDTPVLQPLRAALAR
jgi:protein SCO1/2